VASCAIFAKERKDSFKSIDDDDDYVAALLSYILDLQKSIVI
jgi:hypothetical protein